MLLSHRVPVLKVDDVAELPVEGDFYARKQRRQKDRRDCVGEEFVDGQGQRLRDHGESGAASLLTLFGARRAAAARSESL